jgi:hypothetical protein
VAHDEPQPLPAAISLDLVTNGFFNGLLGVVVRTGLRDLENFFAEVLRARPAIL